MLTGSVSVFSSGSVNEGNQASFTIQGYNLPTGGVTVYYQTTPGSATEGTDYTGLSGSVFLPGTSGMVSVNVSTTADGVYDPGETFSLILTSVTGDATIGTGLASMTINETGSGPPGPNPQYIILTSPGDLNEGQVFTLSGTVSPPGSYQLVGSINWGGFVTGSGTSVNISTTSAGNFTISNVYYDDGPSPGNDTTSDVATIVLNVSANGTQLSAQTTATVHNVAPTTINPSTSLEEIELFPTEPGGPSFVVEGVLRDPGLADVHTVTIDWGDGTDPDVFTQSLGNFSRTHMYPPSGLTYSVTVTIEDDDLGVYSWTDDAPMYLLDLDSDADNNGEINEADDPIENVFPGAYVGVNGDNDNDLVIPAVIDMLEAGPIENENDLEAFRVRWTPAERPEVSNYQNWKVGLYISPAYAYNEITQTWEPTAAAIYGSPDKTNPIPFTNIQVPNGPAAVWSAASFLDLTLYLEARAAGQITMTLHVFDPDTYFSPSSDTVVFTALAFSPAVNLTIHDGQDGKPVNDVDEGMTGAVTVANMNDTDADGISDWEDHTGGAAGGNGVEETRTGADKHGRDEVDLMKLIVHKPIPYTGGAVTLTITQGAARVRLWGDSKKKTEIDAAYDPETGIATWAQWGGGGNRTIWVEIVNPSSAVADVELKLEYGAFVPDIVKATGVWAWETADIYSYTDWADLAGTIWRTQMDPNVQDQVKKYGGTGKRDPMPMGDGTTNQLVANVMAMRFTVTPVDVSTILSRVKFDITRQKETQEWTQNDVQVGPQPKPRIPWPQLWEIGNDDESPNDESAKPLDGGHMFVMDAPRIIDLPSPPEAFSKRWKYSNFREFMRVRFDSKRPAGYNPNPNPPPPPPVEPNDLYFIDGSQCSDKEPWHSRISIMWLGMALKWHRFDGGDNSIGPGNPAIGNDP